MRPIQAPADRAAAILRLLRHPMSSTELSTMLGISSRLVRLTLADMRVGGLVERIGNSHQAVWVALDTSNGEMPPDDPRDAGFEHRLVPAGQWNASVPAGAVSSVFDLGAR